MEYVYETPLGTLKIYAAGGRWSLFVLDDVYGQYDDPVAAADDVALHVTGNADFDLTEIEVPSGLDGWDKIRCRRT